jgi:hypothetical protein
MHPFEFGALRRPGEIEIPLISLRSKAVPFTGPGGAAG